MVALLSEFIVAPGKTDLVCAALDLPSSTDSSCIQTIVASYADVPRRVFVLHVFAGEDLAMRFHQEVLPHLMHCVQPHIDIALPMRKINVIASAAAALAV